MKLGQMASYLDQGLPEPVREALAQLQHDAPPMAPSWPPVVIARSSARPRASCFARVGSRPDRLGVDRSGPPGRHPRRPRGGGEGAVPGCRRGDRSRPRQHRAAVLGAGHALPRASIPSRIVAELRERLVEELDYRLEADHQRLFAEAYRDHPYIHVPEVIGGAQHLAGSSPPSSPTVLASPRCCDLARRGAPAGGRDPLPVRLRHRSTAFGPSTATRIRATTSSAPVARSPSSTSGWCKRFTDDEVRDLRAR